MKKFILLTLAALALPATAADLIRTNRLDRDAAGATRASFQWRVRAVDITNHSGASVAAITNNLLALPTNAIVRGFWFEVPTAFGCSVTNSNTNITFSVGDTALSNKFLGPYWIQNGTVSGGAGALAVQAGVTNGIYCSQGSNNTLVITIATSGTGSSTVANLTNGVLYIYADVLIPANYR